MSRLYSSPICLQPEEVMIVQDNIFKIVSVGLGTHFCTVTTEHHSVQIPNNVLVEVIEPSIALTQIEV